MEEKQIKLSKSNEAIPILSMFIGVICSLISVYQKDLRYLGAGIAVWGIFYFGSFSWWSYLMYKRDRDIMSIITIIMMLTLALLVSLFGVGLFFHHYDIDGLINCYKNLAKYVE